VASGAFVNKDRDGALKRMVYLAATRYSPEQDDPALFENGDAGYSVTGSVTVRPTSSTLRKISLTSVSCCLFGCKVWLGCKQFGRKKAWLQNRHGCGLWVWPLGTRLLPMAGNWHEAYTLLRLSHCLGWVLWEESLRVQQRESPLLSRADNQEVTLMHVCQCSWHAACCTGHNTSW
jgi:hypothetical protein